MLLRGCPGRYVGAHVLLFLHLWGCPGWELMGGDLEWISHVLYIFQHPDRLVEVIHSTTDKNRTMPPS